MKRHQARQSRPKPARLALGASLNYRLSELYRLRKDSTRAKTPLTEIGDLYALGSRLCSTLPSDPPRDDALALRYHVSPSECEEDFHRHVVNHARRVGNASGRLNLDWLFNRLNQRDRPQDAGRQGIQILHILRDE